MVIMKIKFYYNLNLFLKKNKITKKKNELVFTLIKSFYSLKRGYFGFKLLNPKELVQLYVVVVNSSYFDRKLRINKWFFLRLIGFAWIF